jgi:hypothetical protein
MPMEATGMETEAVVLTVHPPEGLQLPHDHQMTDHPVPQHQHVPQPELRDLQDHPQQIICLPDPVQRDPGAAADLAEVEAGVAEDLVEAEVAEAEAEEDNKKRLSESIFRQPLT